MATVCKEFTVESGAAAVWDAVRDYGAVHRRVAAGFVAECRLDGDARIVSFANGLVAREVLVDLDDQARRLAYSVTQTTLTHHNAAFEVVAEGDDRCRVIWRADLLPHEAGPRVAAMMEEGIAAMQTTLGRRR